MQSYGLDISAAHLPGCICAVSALESIYRKHGIHILDRVIRLSVATWEGDLNSLSANMLNGLAKIIIAYGDLLNEMVFKQKLGAVSVRQIARTAKERRAGSLGYAEAMVLEYNEKKQNSKYRLPLHLLYSSGRGGAVRYDLEDNVEDLEQMLLDDESADPVCGSVGQEEETEDIRSKFSSLKT